MKLDRGNPNLMKKAALRVNPHNTLESFGTSKRKHRATVGFVPMPRSPDTVPPATNSLWAQPVYTPPKNEYVRLGANDFLTIKSRGM
jgi:hypothetical protein